MARPRNEKAREMIRREAIELFSKNGYNKTSLSDIAKACDIEKTTLQYYFPYKEILIREFLDQCLTEIAEVTEKLDSTRFDAFGKAFFMGAVSFDFIVNSEKMKKMSMDIIESRSLTSSFMPSYFHWDQWLNKEEFDEDANVMAIGAVYDLIYHYLCNEKEINSRKFVEMSYQIFTHFHGLSRKEAEEKLECLALTDEEIRKASKEVEGKLFY